MTTQSIHDKAQISFNDVFGDDNEFFTPDPIFEISFVNSTSVMLIGYDEKSCTLRVIYNSGAAYDYRNVTSLTFEALVNATSVGKLLNELKKTALDDYTRLSKEDTQRFTFDCLRAVKGNRVFVTG